MGRSVGDTGKSSVVMGGSRSRCVCGVLTTLALVSGACRLDPAEQAKATTVAVSNGFKRQGGVLIAEAYVVTPAGWAEDADELQIFRAEGERATAKVVSHDPVAQMVLLYVRNKKFSGAKIGAATELQEGDSVKLQVLEANPEVQIQIGIFGGWRYHKKRAYLQVALQSQAEDIGVGVFGPDGRLVGVLAFQRNIMSYVLPVEYFTAGEEALTGHPETRRLVGTQDSSQSFLNQKKAAEQYPEPLAEALDFKTIQYKQTFSRTALVGVLTLLDQKEDPAHEKKITYTLKARNSEGKTQLLHRGKIVSGNRQWWAPENLRVDMEAALQNALGEDYVEKNFKPYLYGQLRYRIPFAPFCSKVSEQAIHILEIYFADGRSTGEISFADLINICSAIEEGEGSALEEKWGLNVESTFEALKTDQKKKKGKKKKKGRRGKRKKSRGR